MRIWSLALVALGAIVCNVVAHPLIGGNMNGKYVVASGDKVHVPFNDDYASKGHEYFDVWAPEIATHYGDAFWTSQGNTPLPQHIVERFKGKVMAITGYEQDQVMVTPQGKPGVNPDKDVSVPINWAYNHHYMAWMTGQHAELVEVPAEAGDYSNHGAPTKWVAVEKPSAADRADTSIPTSQMFSEGNGGESRKSFHGYPNGYAQLIESPTSWMITPMQIDTRNRDCGVTPESVTNCTQFTPSIEPKQARYGRGIPKGTNYSGLLECPCNGKYGGDTHFYPDSQTKIIDHQFSVMSQGECKPSQHLGTAAACFDAVAALDIPASKVVNATVTNAKLPQGCSLNQATDGSLTVSFNSAGTGTCGSGLKRIGKGDYGIGTSLTLELTEDGSGGMQRRAKGTYCSQNRVGILKSFAAASMKTSDATTALAQCEAYCLTSAACKYCSVDEYTFIPAAVRYNAIPNCGTPLSWKGMIPGDISAKISSGNATMTISGPASGWFAIGFNAKVMADAPYTIVVNSTDVWEQKIGTCGSEAEHCPGNALAKQINVVSHEVVNGVRTVVVTRSLVGKTKDHYTFGADAGASINILTAIGKDQVFAYHKDYMPSVITVLTPGEDTCVCDMGQQGKLCEPGGKNCKSFTKNCVPPPAGSLLEQRNPTCNSRQYSGGLSCCRNGENLLDADQTIPPQLLRYHMKFRFWFQEYVPATATANASHYDLPRIYYQTEADAGEYDIIPAFRKSEAEQIAGYPNWPLNTPTPGTTCTGTCPDGPDCECEHTITYKWTVSNMRLMYAGGHCHAPACIGIWLYKNDTGKLDLLCHQRPIYGTGNVAADKYDEAGYLALPPCLWSKDPKEGLEPPVWLGPNTPLVSIKKNRNTHLGHYGEMASWQMRGVYFP